MRVLVVEDFAVMARSLGTGLRREGMAVDVVLDGIVTYPGFTAMRSAGESSLNTSGAES